MNLLGYRAFSTELMKIATDVRDADIRAMVAEAHGKEYLPGGQLRSNTEVETNFKPKLAAPWFDKKHDLRPHMTKGEQELIEETPSLYKDRFVANEPGVFRSPTSALALGLGGAGVLGGVAGAIAPAGRRTPAAALGALGGAALTGLAAAYRKMHMHHRHDPRREIDGRVEDALWFKNHPEASEKLASGFMAFTPVGTYNVRGKKPTAQGSAYETASNFAGTALRGGMTGAGAATLGHTLRHGHDVRLAPKHLGMAVAGGAGIALADRALRRHSMKKQLEKIANFTPARQLHATGAVGGFEKKVHNTPLKTTVPAIGSSFRLPAQGA